MILIVFSVKHFFNLFDKQCRFTQVKYSLPGFTGLFRQPAIIKFFNKLLPDSLPEGCRTIAGLFAGFQKVCRTFCRKACRNFAGLTKHRSPRIFREL
jgi:hypothetical protein